MFSLEFKVFIGYLGYGRRDAPVLFFMRESKKVQKIKKKCWKLKNNDYICTVNIKQSHRGRSRKRNKKKSYEKI